MGEYTKEMPYKLRKAPKRDAYWVINTETGTKHSNEALPRDRAEAQMRALYASEGGLKGGAWNTTFYDEILNRNFPSMDSFNPDIGVVSVENQLAFLRDLYAYIKKNKKSAFLKPNYTTFKELVKEKYREIETAEKVLDANLPHKLRKVMFPTLPPLPPPPAPEPDALPVVDRDGDMKEDEAAYYPAEDNTPTSPLSPRVRDVVQAIEREGTEKGLKGRLTGKGRSGLPISLLQILARASYSGRTPLRAGGFELVRSTPTIKIYRKGDGIVVSVRGTDPTDKNDLVADFASVKGGLRETTRYKQDALFLRNFQKEFPRSKYRYTAVGHSLGGAIIDGFFREKLVDNAFSFNPMIEPHERGGNPLHRRLYNNEDPLYLAFGKGVKGVEVRDPRDPLWLAWAKFKLPTGLRELFALYDAHRLQKFKGGVVNFDKNKANTLSTVITDIYPLNQKEDIEEVREVPTGRTKVVKTGKLIPNPAFVALPAKQKANTRQPPPDGVKGVAQRIPETREEDITTRKKVKVGERDLNPIYYNEIDALEKDLRGLAHFYGYRDPAASLGFRVMADEIKNTLPIYQGLPKGVNDKKHNNSQYFTALTMMGENDIAKRNGYAQPTPAERFDEEVAPFFPETQPPRLTDPSNPMRNAKPTNDYGIPPTTRRQKELLLQKYPQIKGKTMYYAVNK